MKKIWSMRKKEDGVSPVIATILMVAITVVLAAVLYVMVLGFGTTQESITVSFSKQSSATNWTLTVLTITGTTQLAHADIYVMAKKADGTIGLTSRALTAMTSGTNYSGVIYNEVGTGTPATEDYLNAGDYFLMNRPIFEAGAQIILTDGGQNTYVTYTI